MTQALPVPTRPIPASYAYQERKNFLYWHDSIIDLLFAKPGISMTEIADRLGRKPNTISLVMRSDVFRARYAQRKAVQDHDAHERLRGALLQQAELAVEVTTEVLKKKRDTVPLPDLVDLQEQTLAALGYGPSKGGGGGSVSVNVNAPNGQTVIIPASKEALEESRRKMRELQLKTIEEVPRADASETFLASEPAGGPEEYCGGPPLPQAGEAGKEE